MPNQILTDSDGIQFKKVSMNQFDGYDNDQMLKQFSRYGKRIGSLLMIFSELEYTLDKAIAFIVNDRSDDYGNRITMDMSFMQKAELYNRFFKLYLVVSDKEDELDKLKKQIDNLKSAARIRNLVAHTKWMSLNEEGFVRSKASLDKEAFIEFRYYKLTPQVLYNLERKIGKIDNDFYNFIEKHNLI